MAAKCQTGDADGEEQHFTDTLLIVSTVSGPLFSNHHLPRRRKRGLFPEACFRGIQLVRRGSIHLSLQNAARLCSNSLVSERAGFKPNHTTPRDTTQHEKRTNSPCQHEKTKIYKNRDRQTSLCVCVPCNVSHDVHDFILHFVQAPDHVEGCHQAARRDDVL